MDTCKSPKLVSRGSIPPHSAKSSEYIMKPVPANSLSYRSRIRVLSGYVIVEGFKLIIYESIYKAGINPPIVSYGKNYRELIDNIAEKYADRITFNNEQHTKFEADEFYITESRYITHKEHVFEDNQYTQSGVEICKSIKQLHYDILRSKNYSGLT